MNGIRSVDPRQADSIIKERGNLVVLDVREPWEFDTCRLPDAQNIPVSSLQRAIGALDASRPHLVYCHHGSRSLIACALLARAGFAEVYNLRGGINGWSSDVDRTVPRY